MNEVEAVRALQDRLAGPSVRFDAERTLCALGWPALAVRLAAGRWGEVIRCEVARSWPSPLVGGTWYEITEITGPEDRRAGFVLVDYQGRTEYRDPNGDKLERLGRNAGRLGMWDETIDAYREAAA